MRKSFEDAFSKMFGRGDARSKRSTSDRLSLHSTRDVNAEAGNQIDIPKRGFQEGAAPPKLKVSKCSKCGMELPARMRACFHCNAPLEAVGTAEL